MAESRYVSLDGMRLHYLDHGSSGKQPLVCIHGLTGNAHNFDRVGALLAPNFHVMSIDVRGRGDSDWGPASDYNLLAYVKDLTALLEHLKISRVYMIGTSMGGIISMIFAA